jgi:hypothetical protein
MPSYRLFFLNEEGRVDGGEAFEAPNDAQAASIFAAIVDACSDVPGAFMLWRGAHRLLRSDSRRAADEPSRRLDVATRRRVLEIQQSILQGRSRVSHSKTLIEAMKSLRDLVEPSRQELDAWASFARNAVNAEKATLQLLDGGELRLIGSHGFDPPFLDFFGVVTRGEQCACSKVFDLRQQVVVPNVQESMLFSGQALMRELDCANVRSVISSPLLAKNGRMVGVVSTHKSQTWSRAENDLERHRQMADQVVAMIAQAIPPEVHMGEAP